MCAVYNLSYEEDGVFLEINAEQIANLNEDTLILHLTRKKITDLDIRSVKNLTSLGGHAKIAPSQIEQTYGEEMIVEIAKDESEAFVKILAPEDDGPFLEQEYAKRMLFDAGVIHGIDEDALNTVISSKDYGEQYVVAKATPQKDGEDGKLIFHFSIDERTGSPVEIGRGRVDLRTLDLFVPVTEGQLLVSVTKAVEGTPGKTVKGNIITYRPGKEIVLPRGKNVSYNDEKTEMYASCPGMVEYVNNSINVSNVYKINGDCDTGVGNIDFEGSVHITGNVRSGYTIKATDGINIGGSVESAKLIAGGNVEVKGGMHGSGRGMIEAGGCVSIMFVEQGAIIADGSVKLDVCMNSKIETGGTLHALGRRGAIIGGQVAVAGDVFTNYIGAVSNTKTEVVVGAMPRKRSRLSVIENELKRLATERIKLDQLDTYLTKTKGTMNNETWTTLHLSSVENRRINAEETKMYTEESELLKYEMEHSTNSKVHVFETAFSGSRVVIGSNAIKIDDEISYSTFSYYNGEVVYGPCEKNKADIN